MKTPLKFPKEPDMFFREVCEAVQQYFKTQNLDKYGNHHIIQKYLVIIGLCIALYSGIYVFSNSIIVFLAYFLLGPVSIILAINISHDAIHGAAHSNRKLNAFFILQMDLMGANSYVWKRRHKTGHHVFPNTLDRDPDLNQTEIVKILPGAKHRSFHKFQHLYVPLLYSVYTINWIYIRDFKDFFSKKSKIENIPTIEYFKLFFFKALYFTLFLGLPLLFTELTLGEMIIGNLLMHIAASYFLTIALVPSHVSDSSHFITPDKSGVMPFSWSHHQVITTTDFATQSAITTWMFGGFNHHVAHHLFPNISYVHYPKITPLIAQLAQKHGLKYKHEDSLLKAYQAHYRLLKNNGKRNYEAK